MTRTSSVQYCGYGLRQWRNATSLLSSANSARFWASLSKSVSSRKVCQSSSTTSRKSTIWLSFMKRCAYFASERIMSMSCAMVMRTPGRWTLMATSSPLSRRTARCTCASEALPSGLESISEKIRSRRSLPYMVSSVARTSSKGSGSTSVWRCESSSQYSGGRISERVESVWPILMKLGPSSSSMERSSMGVMPLRA